MPAQETIASPSIFPANRSGFSHKQCRALILGAGSIGVVAALILKHKGCGTIYLGDTNELRRESVALLGCASVYDPVGENLPDAGNFDLVIDAVGSGRTREAASALVAKGGVISHAGLLANAAGLGVRRLTLEEITFLGNYTYSVVDLRAAIDLLYSGALGSLD
jgi:alcohol dehydrogenase